VGTKAAPATAVAATKKVVASTPAAAEQTSGPKRELVKKALVKKLGGAQKAAAATKGLARKTTAATAANTATRTAAPLGRSTGTPGAQPRVATTEKPWTAKELREIRAELEAERARALADLKIAEADLQGLLTDAGEGAGDDQADAGASIFGREYEMVLANNSREKLEQIGHAVERLDDGSYGVCESCGNAIGKMRLQAAPRATLCLVCKTKQESR
jgi:RNA polymerase-binding protein DksA